MGRKERREMERKIRYLQNNKPWELQTLIQGAYARELIDSRIGSETLAPGDKVVLDVVKITHDPDWINMKQEYKDFVKMNADKVFTLRKEARQSGPFSFVSFEEDENNWMFFTGHVKRISNKEM